MKLGVGLPQAGRIASPQAILQIAQEAERLGYDSLWTYEHLLRPTRPVPGVLGGEPELQSALYGSAYDPLETLAYVAARTERIQLGTSVVNALLHPPLILARRFATLDQLSNGRVIAGLGQGWMEDEFKAVNVPMRRRGSGMEEYVQVLRMIWGPDPVSFRGRFYSIPEAQIGPKPVQPGGIPIILGSFALASLARAARIADGITPGNFPWPVLERTLRTFYAIASQAGRDPRMLQVIIRVVAPPPARSSGPRRPLIGSIEEVCADIMRVEALGATHVIFDLSQDETPIAQQLQFLTQLRLAMQATP